MSNKQSGSSLIFTLIVLVAMLFGAIALFRSIDTSATVAGNLATKESSVGAADIAIKAAFDFLNATPNTSLDSDIGSNNYYAIQRLTTADGIPCSLQYNNTTTACTNSNMSWGTASIVGVNQVYYVIDRLCKASPSTTSTPADNCLAENGVSTFSSTQQAASTNIHFRVSVKVVGPNYSESYVQATIAKPF